MEIIIACIVVSIITSAIITKILTNKHFEIINDHVDEMCDMTKEFIDRAISSLRK